MTNPKEVLEDLKQMDLKDIQCRCEDLILHISKLEYDLDKMKKGLKQFAAERLSREVNQ